MDKVVKTFVSEIRSVNEKDFTLEAVISDETVDRYGEVIKVDAWKKRLGRYKSQAVLLSSHRYDKLTNQIGKAEKIRIEDGKLIAKFKYFVGEGNEEADWGWKLASKYGMAAYSVGFLPYSYDDAEWDEDVKMGKKAGRVYTDVELLEVSQVLVPANPTAMMRSMETLDMEKDEPIRKYFELVQKDLTDFDVIVKEDLNAKDVEDIIETKPDTENYVHIGAPGEEGKHSGHSIKTITISASEGIKAHYCTDCKKITGYLFDKDKGWTHDKAKEWVDDHTKSIFSNYEICYTEKDGDLILTYWLTYDEILEYQEGRKKLCNPKNGDTEIEDGEDMGEVLNAINDLKELVEKKFEFLDSFMKDYNDLFVKDDPVDEDGLDLVGKEIEDENYIKKLLEETNEILTKTISVQSI